MPDRHCEEEYWRRINKVQDYIESHSADSLSVEELAEVAGFSKYHFSRIFQAMLHESLVHYVNRIRMENALFMLAHRPDKNITDIAYEIGMSDSAVFSRAFKNTYGVSPREFRQEYSKNTKDTFFLSDYNKFTAKKDINENPYPVTGKITIGELKNKRLVYVRHTGNYDELARVYSNMVDELFTLADERGLLIEGQNEALTMYHDNPEFTNANQFRTSLCLTVPENIPVHEDERLAVMELERGLYAIGHFSIIPEQFSDAWNYMYHEWLTTSGYVPRNACPFELYLNNPNEELDHLCEVEICVPVELLTVL